MKLKELNRRILEILFYLDESGARINKNNLPDNFDISVDFVEQLTTIYKTKDLAELFLNNWMKEYDEYGVLVDKYRRTTAITKELDDTHLFYSELLRFVLQNSLKISASGEDKCLKACLLAVYVIGLNNGNENLYKRSKFLELYEDFITEKSTNFAEFEFVINELPENHVLKILTAAGGVAQAIEKEDVEGKPIRVNVLGSIKRIEPLEDKIAKDKKKEDKEDKK